MKLSLQPLLKNTTEILNVFLRTGTRLSTTIIYKSRNPALEAHHQIYRLPSIACSCRCYCTSQTQSKDVTIHTHGDLAIVRVPLPSRQETCEFTLKPLSHTVQDFLDFIKSEDGGVDRVALYSSDGVRIAQSTNVDSLLNSPFDLHLNDKTYSVIPPERSTVLSSEDETLRTVKSLICDLYSKMNLDEYQREREEELKKRSEAIKVELLPLEKVQSELATNAQRRTTIMKWTGLGLMGVQFGVLARLTWWEYSWDIMEPVTFFVTYATAIAMYAYFVCTKQDYNYPEVFDRQYLLHVHKTAPSAKFDIHKFNRLKMELAQVQLDLERLRDPLQLNLPIQQILKKKL